MVGSQGAFNTGAHIEVNLYVCTREVGKRIPTTDHRLPITKSIAPIVLLPQHDKPSIPHFLDVALELQLQEEHGHFHDGQAGLLQDVL